MSKITESARGAPCALRMPVCNGDRETTVWCHSPFKSLHGGGMGLKSSPGSDIMGVYGCHDCHSELDGRTNRLGYSRLEKLEVFSRAHAESLRTLIERGVIKI